MLHAQSHALAVRNRLRNPEKHVTDLGIDLKREKSPEASTSIVPLVPNYGVDVAAHFAELTLVNAEMNRLEERRRQLEVILEYARGFRVDPIVRLTAQYFDVEYGDIMSDRRTRDITIPRHVAMYLAKKFTGKSLPEIGRRMGNKDHTTVLSAVRRIEGLMQTDQALKENVDRLCELIQAQ